jgi:hypothetical protein
MNDHLTWTTLCRVRDPGDAEELRAYLESHEVPCFLHSIEHVGLYWLISDAIGGVRVQVPTDHRERAEELLRADASAEVEARPEFAHSNEPRDGCPRCASENVRLDRLERMTKSIALLFTLPFAVGKNLWFCEDCGHSFRVQRLATRWFTLLLVMPVALAWYAADLLFAAYRQMLASIRAAIGLARGQQLCWSCHGELERLGGRCPSCGIELPSAELYQRCVDAQRDDYDGACAECHVPYCVADYEPGAEKWLCSGCGETVRMG